MSESSEHTKKLYPPPAQFSQDAHIPSEAIADRYRETALAQPESYWSELSKALIWDSAPKKVLEWKAPKASWFADGKINVSKNCIDRHAKSNPQKPAIIWEGEPLLPGQKHGEVRHFSYEQLLALTCQIANSLKAMGVNSGDRVAIYMPMVPETVATMQACARIGAVHTVIFGGFSAQSISDRVHDCAAKVIVTADGTYRKGKFLALKPVVDEAIQKLEQNNQCTVQKVLVFRRDNKTECPMKPGRDLSWSDTVLGQKTFCPAVALDSEHPLFILYTSGTTGKPKGLYHTQGGYLLWSHWSTRWIFDLKDRDIYWCTADCGWITGHTYVTYGPLSNGATVFMYEGAPTTPDSNRHWDMIERHQISIYYTAPTAIRMFMKFGEDFTKTHAMKSLRVMGSVGEPINPEAWFWYHKYVGHDRCPIVDTWWQTETGGIMISPLPGATILKPGSATKAMPGIEVDVVNPETGESLPRGEEGALVIKKPWPSMARGIWGDEERYAKTYWQTRPELDGVYLTGDLAKIDADGDVWIDGRLDDVLKLSGHRLGTAEVESALVLNEKVNEAAAVGIPDPVKGQGLVVFVTLKDKTTAAIERGELSLESLQQELRDFVGREIGAHAKPEKVRIAKGLPKTRSGKIMRRLLRELAISGEIKGDTTTLEDISVVEALSHHDD